MEKNLPLDQLKEKNLFFLRTYARNIGIESPTQLSKDELISKIAELSQEGKAIPKATRQPSNNGLTRTRNKKVSDELLPTEKESGKKPLAFNESISEIITIDESCEEREGILDIHTEGYGFIRVKTVSIVKRTSMFHP